MAWGVFYRPEEMEWRPRFRVPLSTALLSDPAFSSDPRTHPHFNAAFNAPPHSRVSTQPPKKIPRPKPIHRPQQISRKASMKALVRRLTSHHNLDRIDELDETDPFGTGHHHDGPYEAIGSTQVQPTPHVHTDIVPRTNVHQPKRAFNPRSLHPTHHQSLRVPSIRGEKGLSLHLKPGQILQHNAIYTSHISSVTSVPSHQSNTPAVVDPDHSPSHSLPNFQPRSTHDSLHPTNNLRNRPSSLLRAPSQRYLEKTTPGTHILPPHHDCDDVPYVPTQTIVTISPPPRHESRLHNLGSSPPSPPTLPPSASRKIRATEGAVPPYDAGHKNTHSLDSHTIDSVITRSSSSIQSKSFEPPRMRHFPKRLVMPAPLQPQPPQPQYRSPAEHADWQDEYPEDRTSVGTDPEGQPVVYDQGPRLLRKKSSAFPGVLPIPHHVPMFQDEVAPEMGDIPAKTNEAERNKEKIRRRRLSKRKNDI